MCVSICKKKKKEKHERQKESQTDRQTVRTIALIVKQLYSGIKLMSLLKNFPVSTILLMYFSMNFHGNINLSIKDNPLNRSFSYKCFHYKVYSVCWKKMKPCNDNKTQNSTWWKVKGKNFTH